VQLAEKIFDTRLREKSVMILGAGQMGEACVRHLAKKGVGSVTVVNRSIERARKLAGEFGGAAVGLDMCQSAMTGADIVVAAAGGDTLLTRGDVEAVMRQRRNRPLFFIDIAVPRNIDPEVQGVGNVFLYNVDHLEEIVRENVRLREMELLQCRAIVDEMASELMARLDAAPARPAAIHSQPRPAWWPGEPALRAAQLS
jgi:glutamyl-tRNA reductase